jgi:hypothetical protein
MLALTTLALTLACALTLQHQAPAKPDQLQRWTQLLMQLWIQLWIQLWMVCLQLPLALACLQAQARS